jgi:uncharacterized protein involved in cysteine biosynthesis
MNIVFYLLLVVLIAFIWFALAFLFKPIGKWISRLYKDVMNEMTEEKEN